MSKSEVLQELRNNGQIEKFSRTPSWEKAFDLYNAEKKTKLRPSCGSCFREVKAWLQS